MTNGDVDGEKVSRADGVRIRTFVTVIAKGARIIRPVGGNGHI